VILFLDIDGVLRKNGSTAGPHTLDPVLVQRLNFLCANRPLKIVTNTAWNGHGLPFIRQALVDAGFDWPICVQGKTASSFGGGALVREWLSQHAAPGTPYIILDDSAKDYGSMWGRLVKLDGKSGLTEPRMFTALKIIEATINDKGERQRAARHIQQELWRLSTRTPWLKPEDRAKAIKEKTDLLAHVLSVEDFLADAMLK
jgi:hypothetical protein